MTALQHVRRVLALYRRSRLLAFLVDHSREARRLARHPKAVADEAHLTGAWNFASPIERTWQRHALEAIAHHASAEPWGDALEIGCSEGAFTEELARSCRAVAACDLSSVALDRASNRLRGLSNVTLSTLDFVTQEVPGQYDLVFAMDVLWLVSGRTRKAAVGPKLTGALRDGGLLIFSDSRMPRWARHPSWSRLLPTGADEWADRLAALPGMRVVHREVYAPEGGSTPAFWEKLFVIYRKDQPVMRRQPGDRG